MHLFLGFLIALFTIGGLSAEPPESVVIVTYKVAGAAPWDPDSVKSGITGSEEAVIYMSQKLAEIGYKVTVLGDPPQNSPHSAPESNPRYLPYNFTDGTIYDVAIAWRMPWSAEMLKKYARSVYLWPHDTFESRLSAKEINGFDGVLWVSQWQKDYWTSINPEFAKFETIFGNGINPDQFKPITERKNPYSCIYGSNYSRGLEILLDFWPKLKNQFPMASLDIYYGWQHWGLLTPDKENKLRQQIKLYKEIGVNEHGLVSHEELNRAYENASFWTYPCLYPEVFCITALRAQLAGAVPVIIETAALPETVRAGYKCTHSTEYFDTLSKAFSEVEKISLEERKSMGDFVLKEYTWDVVANKWKNLFDSDKPKRLANLVEPTLPVKDLKTLILIIASDNNEAYLQLQKVWEAYMNSDPDHFEVYFMRANDDLPVPFEIKKNEIIVKTPDGFSPGIINKTLISLKALKPRMHEFDYVIRTNLSSFYVFPKLLKFLETCPRSNCYKGVPLYPCELPSEFLNIPFISGAGIIMSRDVAQLLAEESHQLEKYKSEIPDDVFIGMFFQQKNIPAVYAPRSDYQTKAAWLNGKNSVPEDAFHFRARSHQRFRQERDPFADELFILKDLLQRFYGKTLDEEMAA